MWDRIWPALLAAAALQRGHQRADDPATRFIDLLRAALTSGIAHVATVRGGLPQDCQAWGWQTVDDPRPLGRLIGWIDGEELYLQPDAAFQAAQEAGTHGHRLSVTPRTLHARLKQKGYLVATDQSRDTSTVRQTIQGHRQEVLHVKTRIIFEPAGANQC